jgi:hypothetical protein
MPAWIHPIRLTTIADAHERLNAICSHLRACSRACDGQERINVTYYAGIVADGHDRSEVDRCCGHAELIAVVLGWAEQNTETADAIVTECHAAQSSGGADLVLLKGDTVHLFEAAAGTGINIKQKHKDDVRILVAEEMALLSGRIVKAVKKYRVVPTSVLAGLPLAARSSVLASIGDVSVIHIAS